MRKFLFLAALAISGTAVHAATISYNAITDCGDTCVTVSLSWADLALPVSVAEVTDDFGDVLFNLNVPFPPTPTGSILPNPQTIFGISGSTFQVITNGDPASLDLLAPNGQEIASVLFVAQIGATVPEPAGWAAAGFGLALLLMGKGLRRRQSQS